MNDHRLNAFEHLFQEKYGTKLPFPLVFTTLLGSSLFLRYAFESTGLTQYMLIYTKDMYLTTP